MVEEQASSTVGRIVFRRRTYGLPRQDVTAFMYIHLGLHVYTSRPPRIYISASTYIRLGLHVYTSRSSRAVLARGKYSLFAQ